MIDFRPLVEDDLPLVAEWLGREHIAPWWREPIEHELEELRKGIAGQEPTRYFLILCDRRPIGLIQTYLAADYPEWNEIVQVDPGVAGVDLLVGEQELVGRGLGARILDEFVNVVVFADPDVHACIATPEEANRRSWRAFEKAGFRHVRDVEEDGVPCRLMRLDRG